LEQRKEAIQEEKRYKKRSDTRRKAIQEKKRYKKKSDTSKALARL
jgi:hypothetical protein